MAKTTQDIFNRVMNVKFEQSIFSHNNNKKKGSKRHEEEEEDD